MERGPGEKGGEMNRISAFELAKEHSCVVCCDAEGFAEEGG
jgi:hypothetical protein